MKNWLTRNFLLKLLSFAVALGIWLWVSGEEKLEFSFPAPLLLQNLPDQVALAAPTPDQVMVRLRAPEALLKRLAAGDLDARLDLTGISPGEHQLPLTPDRVRVPFGAEVVNVRPEQVPVVVERRVRRQVPVEARVEGEIAAGLAIGEISVDPPRVAVEGPERAVAALRHVSTERVPLEGRRSSFSVTANLVAGHPLLRVVPETPVRVRVHIVAAAAYNDRRDRH